MEGICWLIKAAHALDLVEYMDEHGNFSTLSSDNKEEIRQLLGPRLTLTDDGRIKARREQMNLADEMKFFRFLVTHTSPSVGAQVRAIWDLI